MRRGLGRGRSLIGIGAVIALIGIVLPWEKVGGVVLPVRTEWGLAGPSVLVFLAAVGMLAVVVLPYTTKSGDASLDRIATYVALLGVGLGGLVLKIINLVSAEGTSLGPTDVPGLWLSVIGMAVMSWGVAELFAERPR